MLADYSVIRTGHGLTPPIGRFGLKFDFTQLSGFRSTYSGDHGCRFGLDLRALDGY